MNQRTFIAHQVFFRFKEGIDWDNEKAKKAEQVTLRLPLEITQIKAWFCGRSVIARAQAVDFSLIGYFADREALDAYMVHPHHLVGIELWKEISTWTVSDIVVTAADLDKLSHIAGTEDGL
jgi:hypothetical protein